MLPAMKLTWFAIAVALLGCGSKKDGGDPDKGGGSAKTAEPAPAAAAPPAPFTGPLTTDLVMGAKDVVNPLEPWDAGLAKLQAKLGKPTNTKDDKYQWAVMDGDTCAYLYVTKEDGKKYNKDGSVVGAVTSPMKVDKSGPVMNRQECLAILGKTDEPPEDPNAKAPPADGKATVKLVLDNAVKARSKWNGQQLTVSGVLKQISTSSSTVNGVTTQTTYVYLTDASDKDKHETLTCSQEPGTKLKPKTGKPLKVKGTLKIDKAMNGNGETVFSMSLEHCTPVK